MTLPPFAQALLDLQEVDRTAFLAAHPAEGAEADALALAEWARAAARSQPGPALEAARAARLLSVERGFPLAAARAMRAEGVALWTNGRLAEAWASLQGASEEASAAGDPLLSAQSLILGIEILAQQGRQREAAELSRELEERLTALGAEEDVAKVRANAGNVHFQREAYGEALRCWEAARDWFLARGNALAASSLEVNLAHVLTHLHRLPEALAMYRRADQALGAAGVEVAAAGVEGSLGYLEHVAGRYTDALRTYGRARDRFAALELPRDQARCDRGIAGVYLDLNLIPEAREAYQRVLPLFQELGMSLDAARSELSLAACFQAEGRHAEAQAALDGALARFQRERNEIGAAQVRLQRAGAVLRSGTVLEDRLPEALRDAASAARVFRRHALPAGEVAARLLACRLRLETGEVPIRALAQLLRTAEAGALGSLQWQIEWTLARAYGLRGKDGEALRHYRRAGEAVEQLRGLLQGEEFRRSFLQDKAALHEEHLALLLDRGTPRALREAFALAERVRSRTLVELLARSVETSANVPAHDPVLRARLEALRSQLRWDYARLGEAAGETDAAPPGEAARFPLSAPAPPEQVRRLEREYQDTRRQLQLAEAGDGPEVAAASLREIQRLLGEEERLVEFLATRDEVLAFVVGPREFHTLRGLASRSEVSGLAARLRFQWSRFGSAGGRPSPEAEPEGLEAVREPLGALHELLLEPLLPYLEGVRQLTLIPHGVLHGVPFHALWNGEEYAADRWELSYAPSATVAHLCRLRPEPQSETSLLYGIPDAGIAHVREELQTLQALLPEARALLDGAATLESLPREGEYRYLHFATHAVFRQDNPLFSGLRLSDGWLIAHDLYSRRLRCRLATLAACGTGMSGITPDDEVLGLVRGFLHAGAAAVMVSLWSADDAATAQLMQHCYAELARGGGRAAALRAAQQEVRKSHPHPYYWAPFVLIGAR